MGRDNRFYLGRLDADVLIQLRVRQRQLHSFLDLLHLLLQPSYVRIGLQGRLLHLHMCTECSRTGSRHEELKRMW